MQIIDPNIYISPKIGKMAPRLPTSIYLSILNWYQNIKCDGNIAADMSSRVDEVASIDYGIIAEG